MPGRIRALERNSYEAEEMVEPDGRDGGRHGDLLTGGVVAGTALAADTDEPA